MSWPICKHVKCPCCGYKHCYSVIDKAPREMETVCTACHTRLIIFTCVHTSKQSVHPISSTNNLSDNPLIRYKNE